MKKFLIWLLLSFITISIVLYFLVLPNWLKNFAEKTVFEKSGYRLVIGGLSLSLLPSPGLELDDVKVEGIGTFKKIDIEASFPTSAKIPNLKIRIVKPEITWTPKTSGNASQDAAATESAPVSPKELGIPEVQIEITDGSFQTTQNDLVVALTGLDANIRTNPENPIATLDLHGDLELKKGELINTKTTVFLTSQLLDKGNSIVAVEQMQLTVFGLSLNGGATLDQKVGALSATLKVDVPALEKLPMPNTPLPYKSISGMAKGSFDLVRKNSNAEIEAQGALKLENVRIDLDQKSEAFTVLGPGYVDQLEIGFSFSKTLQIQKLSSQIRLEDVELQKLASGNREYFKPSKVPLSLKTDISGQGTQLNIRSIEFLLDKWLLKASGTLNSDSLLANLKIEVPPAPLAGLGQYLPKLGNIQGELSANAQIIGPLKDPAKLDIDLYPLEIKNLKTNVAWKSQDGSMQAQGPISANTRISGKISKLVPSGLQAMGEINFTQLMASKKDSFEKPAGTILTLDYQIRQNANKLIDVTRARLVLGSGVLQASGQVQPQGENFNLNLRIGASNLQFLELAKLTRPMKLPWPSGSMQSQLALKGIFDSKLGFMQSPLAISGSADVKIPKFVYAAPAAAKEKSSTQEKPAPVTEVKPLAPWPIVGRMDFKLRLGIQELQYNDLKIQGAQINASIQKGVLGLQGKLERIFDGQVVVNRFSLPLLISNPKISSAIKVVGIDLAAATNWASPEWKDTVKGSFSGEIENQNPMPSSASFKDQLTAQGKFDIQNGWVSTMQLDQLVNDKLSKIPKIGDSNRVATKGVAARIQSRFALAKQVLTLTDFQFLTPEKNEIQASGTVGFNKLADLQGTAFLATAPVGGSVRAANSDGQGRLQVPILIRGDLAKPSLDFAQGTVEGMLAKTAQYELQKQKGEVKKQLEDKVNELKEKGLKSIFGG